MEAQIIKSLEEFVDKANVILINSILSAYCFGSATYEYFHSGYRAVALFNKRAIKVYEKIGFQSVERYMQKTNGGEFEFIKMKKYI